MWLSNLGRRSLDPVFEKVDNPEAEFAEWLMQLGCEESHYDALVEAGITSVSALMVRDRPCCERPPSLCSLRILPARLAAAAGSCAPPG